MNKTIRTILIVLAVIVGAAAVIAIAVFFFGGIGRGFFRNPIAVEGYHTFRHPDDRIFGQRAMLGYTPFGFIGGLLFRLAGLGLLAVLIALLVWAASRLFSPRRAYQTQSGIAESLSIQEILDRRYARGEISREEYLQVLKDTGRPAPGMPPAPEEPPASE